jgi:Family of unknown function (DUF6037)
MTSLRKLHESMIEIGSEMQQFRIKTGAIEFDCLFSVRDTPNFTLSLTSRGLNPRFFLLEVERGYWIKPFFGKFYGELAALLNTGANSGNKLIPKDWLSQINVSVPSTATINNNPTNCEIIRLRPDISEDRDKPYFDTWTYWSQDSGRSPRRENLNKTRMIMGVDAVNYSIKMNASSRWSAVDLGRSFTKVMDDKLY